MICDRTGRSFQIKTTVSSLIETDRRRTYHELNSLNLVRFIKSSTQEKTFCKLSLSSFANLVSLTFVDFS